MEKYLHTIQYYETDRMGCVHHSNYIRWFEEARCCLLKKYIGGYDRLEAAGVLSPVLNVSADYISMSRFGETVEILVSIIQYTGTRISFSYNARDVQTSTIRCKGETLHCFIDENGRPLSLRKKLPEFDLLLNDFKSLS